MAAHRYRRSARSALSTGALVVLTTALLAQAGPPVPGATGVIVPEGGGDGATDAIGAGTRHVIDAVKGVVGGKGEKEKRSEVDAFAALKLGTKVGLRYSETKDTEGTVIELDRQTGVIVVRLADKTTDRLQLEERARRKADGKTPAPSEAIETVAVSYPDANGEKLSQNYRRVP